jgi:polar amino acid transport system ATP-binding protein
MPLLELLNIKKSFGDNEVLKDISLKVESGEVVSILGPSGSGKTTFLRCATMLESIDSGIISYDGTCAYEITEEKRYKADAENMKKARETYGLVFQNFNLFPHFDALKNVAHAPEHVKNVSKEEAKKEALSLLEKVGLKGKENLYPYQLSGGQQQRVAIARALAMHPKILFFDEPTSALDPEITAGILSILKELASEHMTMVIVTHEIDFARKVSDRVVFMDEGLIVEEGAPEDVIDNPSNERTRSFLNKLK